MEVSPITEALTFDDVLLVPQASDVLPTDVVTSTQITPKIQLHTPILSAAMDTVTEARTAIVMAQHGGLGVIHKNGPIAWQAAQVQAVKKFESGIVTEPVTLRPEEPLQRAIALQQEHRISGFPITTASGQLVGMLTNRDIRAEADPTRRIAEVMTPRERLVTGPEGISPEAAIALLHRHRVEKLPVIDASGALRGLITIKDIQKTREFPLASKDAAGRLRVAAAVGVGAEALERAAALIAAGVDLVCVDTAHGHSRGVLDTVRAIKQRWPDREIMAGNISTADGAKALLDVGADAIKIGQGPGSICTTRVVSGCGMPQLSAILECARITRGTGVPLIADGGIKYSGDVVKACAAGAAAVMVGSLFAGTDESPGELVLYQGRSYKMYRGMGSLSAMVQGSRDRYGQGAIAEARKLVPEGVEGRVPYRGPLSDTLYQLVGGLRSGMGYIGARDLAALQARARFVRISSAGLKESHVHDVTITKEAPNYSA